MCQEIDKMKDQIEKDMPEALKLLENIKRSSKECFQQLRLVIAKVKDGPSTSQGISFLDIKNQLLASYMADLCFLMDEKTCGQSVAGSESIDRLIEIRTVLEKMRPIEHKLKYQINKVVSAYKEGKFDPSDPRKFKPNFAAFSNMPDDDSSDDEGKKWKKKDFTKFYVAPKVAPVHYSDDETAEERQTKEMEKRKKRVLSSTMVKEMREQYTDAPVEITESWDLHRVRDNKREKERLEYEENNFVRLSLSKKEAAGRKKMATMSALGTLADFDDISALDRDGEEPTHKKKKGNPKKSKKKGFRNKGRKFGKRK